MKRASRPRTTAQLSDSMHSRLNMYTLAATAAGVASLALPQAVEAKIVYTPAHVKLSNQTAFHLDLNHDGIVDFYLVHEYVDESSNGANRLLACHRPDSGSGGHTYFCLSSTGYSPNAIRVIEKDQAYGADLPLGATIRLGDLFPKKAPVVLGGEVTSFSNPRWYGPWVNGGKGVKNRYLGIKFLIEGCFHYGWVRMTVTTTSNTFTATVTGYAYETIPGKAIIAGKTKDPDVTTVRPASLGHLAAGASAIPAWRVKRTAATTD